MTLADLCTSLIERESVIHSFRGAIGTQAARTGVTQEQITEAACKLTAFTHRELVAASGCSFTAAQRWTKARAGRDIIEVGRATVFGGGSTIVWRWL
jgi:hypothetical protein